jgi:hypothetical protein
MAFYRCVNCDRSDFATLRELLTHECQSHDHNPDPPDGTSPATITGGFPELYYPTNSGSSGPNRTFHLNRDCDHLARTDTIQSCHPAYSPRGTLCASCAPDITISDLSTPTTQPPIPTPDQLPTTVYHQEGEP